MQINLRFIFIFQGGSLRKKPIAINKHRPRRAISFLIFKSFFYDIMRPAPKGLISRAGCCKRSVLMMIAREQENTRTGAVLAASKSSFLPLMMGWPLPLYIFLPLYWRRIKWGAIGRRTPTGARETDNRHLYLGGCARLEVADWWQSMVKWWVLRLAPPTPTRNSMGGGKKQMLVLSSCSRVMMPTNSAVHCQHQLETDLTHNERTNKWVDIVWMTRWLDIIKELEALD